MTAADRQVKVPETARELREAAWGVANGMRVVDDLLRRASALVAALDRAETRGEVLDASVVHTRERLRELTHTERAAHREDWR